jgi:dihydrodipicolinate synthase/N-acetylneuraminate lyase
MGVETSTRKTYCGVIVPMVTPLTKDGELDEPGARRIIDHLIAGGVQGIFVLGTTGEGPSLPREMRSRLVHLTLDYTAGRVQVYTGVFDNIVSESIDAARDYLRRGATAIVAQLPNYYKLAPDQQFQYFSKLVDRVKGPLILYDIPTTVHMSIDPGVVEHLRAFRNVVGIKDSSGDPERLALLLESYADDSRFSVLVGTTGLASFGFEHGADGFVPSVANLNPALCARLFNAAEKGDSALMASLQREVDALSAEFTVDGYIGSSISRLKQRLAQRQLCGPHVLPPLQEAEQGN